jgi:hypothetical protein
MVTGKRLVTNGSSAKFHRHVAVPLCVDGNLLGRRNKVIQQVQPLLDYISTSPVLTLVEFHSAKNHRRGLLDKLLRAPASNSNIVEKFRRTTMGYVLVQRLWRNFIPRVVPFEQ